MSQTRLDCCIFFFFILVCEAIGTVATPGLLCQPQVIVKMIVEKQMECRLAGETEVLGENPPQRHFCPSQNPTWPDPGLNPGCRGGKPVTNRLSYGAATDCSILGCVFWLCPFMTPQHGFHGKHSLYCWQGVFTAWLPSNWHPTVVCFGSHGNVCTESLPSNEYTCHNTIKNTSIYHSFNDHKSQLVNSI
jgi:hypothetical protein